MSFEITVYCIRPDRTALWLPKSIADSLKIKSGHQLTTDEFNHAEIQGYISRKIAAQTTSKKKPK